MKDVRRFRVMASLCRQQAAYNSARSSQLIAEADYWERLARAEISSYFKECSTAYSDVQSIVADGTPSLPREDSRASDLAAALASEGG